MEEAVPTQALHMGWGEERLRCRASALTFPAWALIFASGSSNDWRCIHDQETASPLVDSVLKEKEHCAFWILKMNPVGLVLGLGWVGSDCALATLLGCGMGSPGVGT